jgi:hypothetical protein
VNKKGGIYSSSFSNLHFVVVVVSFNTVSSSRLARLQSNSPLHYHPAVLLSPCSDDSSRIHAVAVLECFVERRQWFVDGGGDGPEKEGANGA